MTWIRLLPLLPPHPTMWPQGTVLFLSRPGGEGPSWGDQVWGGDQEPGPVRASTGHPRTGKEPRVPGQRSTPGEEQWYSWEVWVERSLSGSQGKMPWCWAPCKELSGISFPFLTML